MKYLSGISQRSLLNIALVGLAAFPLACSSGESQDAGMASAQAAPAPVAAPVESTPEPATAAPIKVAAADEATPYEVECADDGCVVDKATFIGWRTYHAFCHVCHAQDAVGSTFAPSLVDRMNHIDKERFLHVVAEGYTGQIGVMPPWKDNPNISKRYEELYGYLKARADGVLKPGRPKKKKVAK